MKKKLSTLALLLAAVFMALSLAGCSAETGSSSNGGKFPSGPITFIVPYAPGGANDICARLIAPEMEKILGVPVTVTNVEGGSGWIGWGELLAADADGLTISMVSSPAIIAGYLNPDAGRSNTYEDFAPLINFANDYQVVCAKGDDDRFNSFSDLYEYSKSNEVLISGVAGASSDGLAIAKLNTLEGAKFVHLATNGASESLTNLYGGHCDVCIADISEIPAPLAAGQIKALAVLASDRVPQNPDIPTVKEEVGVELVNYSARGVATKAGVPEESLTILRDALKQALESTELQETLAAQGIVVEISEWEEYRDYLASVDAEMREYGPKYFGWEMK